MKKIRNCFSFLVVFALFTLLVIYLVPTVQASEKKLDILRDGQVVEEVQLEQDEKILLTTCAKGLEERSFQWQIMQNVQEAVWVDIYDRTEDSCEVSYALVKNMLDEADSVYVRCVAQGEGDDVCSNAVCVVVQPEKDEETATSVTTLQTQDVQVTNESEGDTTAEYVTITIKYLDSACYGQEEETAIYSPYVATIERNTEFKQDVVSPTFLGFAPYLMSDKGEKGDEASVLKLDYPKVTDNIVIYVYYFPIEVNFAVKYFFQNVNDDLYTEDVARYRMSKAETGTIIANDELEKLAGDTTGFTKMYHIPENVAADGSTVFECYYDRNYYLIEFDLGGGYGVKPVYARYGAAFVVNEPVRHGYLFTGWKLVKVDKDEDGTWDDVIPEDMKTEMVSNIPAYNCLYQAQWERIDTSYTVVYWLKRNDGTKQYLDEKTVSENVKSGDVVSGKNDLSENLTDEKLTDEIWYYEYVTADSNVLVEGDGSTIVNVYYKPKRYTLRFYYAASTGDEIKIIGGSTYTFGHHYGENTADDATLLKNVFAISNVGTIEALPTLNEKGKKREYIHGTLESDGTTYHYIEFKAEYGQNISELWPCSVFEPAVRTEITTNKNGWTGKQAFVAGWNGEHHVAYSMNNENETIKGNYEKLDSDILFHKDYRDVAETSGDRTVSYLCFWENGAGRANWNIPKLFVYRIWVPVIQGEDVTGLSRTTYNGVEYKLIDSYDTCDNSDVGGQTIPSLEGYTNVGKEGKNITLTEEQKQSYASGTEVNFYYRRNENSFVMRNYDENIVETTVAYGYQLSGFGAEVPSYPKKLEENAYEFEGWYTTEKCIKETKVDLATYRMPDSGLMLYANWEPKKHTVQFFTTYDEMKAYEEGTSETIYQRHSVSHGNVIGTVDTPVRSGDGELTLIFAGWFYMEAGQKKAFSSLNIPVNKDLNLFAEWSSHSPQPYRIRYVRKDNPEISVAEDTIGYAYGGSTRTFYAKAGKPFYQLKDEYNTGWFPTVSSHSITIQAEADKDHLQYNTYTFYYVEAKEITYTVRYVNKETGQVLSDGIVQDTTTDAVVTVRFKAYENMVPDAFYKRLILEVKEDQDGNYVGTENNVITFYYTPNKTSAFYAVHYMLEKEGANDEQKQQYAINGTGGYEEAVTHEEAVGQIGNTICIQPQSISGFTLIEDDTGKVPIVWDGKKEEVATKDTEGKGYQIKITEDGTELYLFYRRNIYPYVVHYYQYNTTTPVDGYEDKKGDKPYDSEVTEEAISIEGYTCVSEKTQTITIREDDGNKGLNDIIFYYAPIQYVVEYKAVPEEGGWLSNTIEVKAGKDFEGSVPTAGAYYQFVGWYQDEKCTESVPDKMVDTTDYKLNPNLAELSETESNIFYAKFERKVGDFTIIRENVTDNTQVFVYEVINVDTNETINMTITGNGSVTIKNLPFGKYTVTQQNGWSWRYNDISQTLIHTGENGTTCQFNWEEVIRKWLNGNSSVVKNQRRQSQ